MFFLRSTSWSQLLLFSLCVLATQNVTLAAAPKGESLLQASLDVTLPNVNGQPQRLTTRSETKLRVFCFLGCECPLAKLYGPRLQLLYEEFTKDSGSRQVEIIGINSNLQDSIDDVRAYAEKHELKFPILKDSELQVAEKLRATRTPEVVVLDNQGREVYRGRIDDQYQPGLNRQRANREDLKLAITETLNNQAVSVPRTEAIGCLITRPKSVAEKVSVTYTGQIARVLNEHCVECHRAGEIGPFVLDNYQEVVGWGDMIIETIDQHRMPPWHASPDFGDFRNTRAMPDSDRNLLREWVNAGMPLGTEKELATTEFKKFDNPETSDKPDFVIDMDTKPFPVPAEGTIEYQYFLVDPGFTEDRWIRQAEIVPGNRQIVHHGIVFIRPPDGVHIDGIGWLTAYVPGQRRIETPATLARLVPAGSKLVFQMHYTPNGRATSDLSTLKLYFADSQAVTHQLSTLLSINQELEIPPGLSDVPVEAQTNQLPQDATLLALAPHMHLRGKSVRVSATDVAGQSKILLDVPHYDFNWQHSYILKEALPLKHIQNLSFVAKFDNSKDNPNNPNPADFVTWGDQTWEEMAIVFYEVARPLKKAEQSETLNEKNTETFNTIENQKDVKIAQTPTTRHQQMADEYFANLDKNKDGKIDYSEVDRAVQLRFYYFDLNGDRQIERNELLDAIRQR